VRSERLATLIDGVGRRGRRPVEPACRLNASLITSAAPRVALTAQLTPGRQHRSSVVVDLRPGVADRLREHVTGAPPPGLLDLRDRSAMAFSLALDLDWLAPRMRQLVRPEDRRCRLVAAELLHALGLDEVERPVSEVFDMHAVLLGATSDAAGAHVTGVVYARIDDEAELRRLAESVPRRLPPALAATLELTMERGEVRAALGQGLLAGLGQSPPDEPSPELLLVDVSPGKVGDLPLVLEMLLATGDVPEWLAFWTGVEHLRVAVTLEAAGLRLALDVDLVQGAP
jgi:hypothetical protein